MSRPGKVFLVGAGPGDPELITVRGLRLLREADVVVYDRLVDPCLLDEAPREAERVFAGKAAGFAFMSQRSIESILVARARAGRRVVRLKGGDPFVFGRGAEEIEALESAGVDYEIVSGVTSAVAAPAAAGIPVTHRDLASCVTFVTGHEDPSKGLAGVDWEWLARGSGTLVVLMGLERLRQICARLIEGGLDPGTPAAVVSHGTMPGQKTVLATLGTLPDAAERDAPASPATLVIGEVAGFPEFLASLRQDALPQAV